MDSEKIKLRDLGVLVGRKILEIQKSHSPPGDTGSTARNHLRGLDFTWLRELLMILGFKEKKV